jgi:sugar phosphate isomerase/epimerase
MQLDVPGRPHLTYCTNIHPGESLAEVRAVVEGHVPRVRERLGVVGPFGVGLRLSARAAEELSREGALQDFRALLAKHDLYVFTINGFPYGAFHGERVKESVYRPDWREDERVVYSDRLARILAELLPDGVDGSISTVPGAFAPRVAEPDAMDQIRSRLVQHAAALFRLREDTGRVVELALEPEPACLLETSSDAVRFFTEYVFAETSVRELAALTGLPRAAAHDFLRRHLGVCLDACHFAVAFEDAGAVVSAFDHAGIRIGKVQITTALTADFAGTPDDGVTLAALRRFADPVYFHQVVTRSAAGLAHYVDLPDALAAATARGVPESEWRIHFHVPVFCDRLDVFGSTQPFLRDLLAIAARRPVSAHLEVETYTWDVLPPEHRILSVDHAIARELEFSLSCLRGGH